MATCNHTKDQCCQTGHDQESAHGVDLVSVVIPLFNETECLPDLERELCAVLPGLGKPYEVLLVNDGSTDSTRQLLEELCFRRPEFRAIHFARNSGQSAAMAAGFRAARGSIIVTLDADLQN
ncbi:MAG: glycosyltransferase, partial [Planctomycetota bacterium]